MPEEQEQQNTNIKLSEDEIKAYWDTIETCEKFMAPKHELWRKLLKQYELDIKIDGVEYLIPISRFYPLVRQIIASIAFHYPKIFMKVDGDEVQLPEGYAKIEDILERSANSAIKIMKVKAEIHQMAFDALFCCIGWGKTGYNPPGDDMIAPYIANDAMEEDFPYFQRVSPFNILPDPLTPPHNYGHSRFTIEKMYPILEFLKEDDRYDNTDELKAITPDDTEEALQDFGRTNETDAEWGAVQDARKQGGVTLVYEIHDRIHKRRVTLAKGLKGKPLQAIQHPFIRTEAQIIENPLTGEQVESGDYKATGGFLVENGSCYFPLKFDMTGEGFYGKPAMEYARPIQDLIIESLSRRADLLKRFKQVMLVNKAERSSDAQVGSKLENAKDGSVIFVEDNRNIREAFNSPVPPDQIALERDAIAYEEQITGVSEMARGGGPTITATQAALVSSHGQLNREWMQSKIGDCYRAVTANVIQIMGDSRYTPDRFIQNVAPEESGVYYQALSSDVFAVRKFQVEVVAGSMQPLIEQLERQDMLDMYSQLRSSPNIDQVKLDKMLVRAFRHPNPDELFKDSQNADAIKAAQLENIAYFLGAQPSHPGVTEGEDHGVHIEIHTGLEQMSEFLMLPPEIQNLALQTRNQHVSMHQEAQGNEASALGHAAPARKSSGGNDILSTVQSNAQKIAQAAKVEAEKTTEQA
jgi:hypothetical protein